LLCFGPLPLGERVVVVFENVEKTYPASWLDQTAHTEVLKGLSFEALPGEIVGVVGANGAGKTTAFRILAGLEPWDRGNVIVNGVNARNAPQWIREHVGILLEKHGFPKMPGQMVLEQTGLCMGLTLAQSRQRASELVEELDMGAFVGNMADKYSRGQLGRLGIARMMMVPAPVLVFDEPTVGLDFLSAERVRKFIRASADKGHTVLLATHLLNDIKLLCDQIVGLENGVRTSDAVVRDWLRAQEQVSA